MFSNDFSVIGAKRFARTFFRAKGKIQNSMMRAVAPWRVSPGFGFAALPLGIVPDDAGLFQWLERSVRSIIINSPAPLNWIVGGSHGAKLVGFAANAIEILAGEWN